MTKSVWEKITGPKDHQYRQPTGAAPNGNLPPPPPKPPAVVPATKSLGTNLQRAIDAYNRRAQELQTRIDADSSERADVLKARDAAAMALEALVEGVMTAAVERELCVDESGQSAGFGPA